MKNIDLNINFNFTVDNLRYIDFFVFWSILLTLLSFMYLMYKYFLSYGNIISHIIEYIRNFFSFSEIKNKYPIIPNDVDEAKIFKKRFLQAILLLTGASLFIFIPMNKYFKDRWDLKMIHIKIFNGLINFRFNRIVILLLWSSLILSYLLPLFSLYKVHNNQPIWFLSILSYIIPSLMRILFIDRDMSYSVKSLY